MNIKSNNTQKISVIVADVTSFFDNLDHRILKRQWSTILNATTLPADHYNVYKTLSRIKYVEGSQLFKCYKKTMIVEKGIPNNSKKIEYKLEGVKLTSRVPSVAVKIQIK